MELAVAVLHFMNPFFYSFPRKGATGNQRLSRLLLRRVLAKHGLLWHLGIYTNVYT